MKKPLHFMVSRTDNIGDVVLTLAVASVLKKNFPSCRITFLIRRYTQAVIEACPFVDNWIDWEVLRVQSDASIQTMLKKQAIDVIIHAFPSRRIAKLARKTNIPMRIGTTRRAHHWFDCTHRVPLKARDFHAERLDFLKTHSIYSFITHNLRFLRSFLSCGSSQYERPKPFSQRAHESAISLQLLDPLGLNLDLSDASLVSHTVLSSPVTVSSQIHIDPHRFTLILHAGSNGHGREWPVDYFVTLIHKLPQDAFQLLLTGSAEEKKRFQADLQARCPQAIDLMGKLSLASFLSLIAQSDGLIASGTGPLHMAAALGIKTIGLFPAKRNIGPVRWRPIGKQACYLCAKTCTACRDARDCQCMRQITPAQVLAILTT